MRATRLEAALAGLIVLIICFVFWIVLVSDMDEDCRERGGQVIVVGGHHGCIEPEEAR